MEAAKKALENSAALFPQLDYQKRVMAHSMKRQNANDYDADEKCFRTKNQSKNDSKKNNDQRHLPKQYRVQGDTTSSSESDSDDEVGGTESDTSDDENDNGEIGNDDDRTRTGRSFDSEIRDTSKRNTANETGISSVAKLADTGIKTLNSMNIQEQADSDASIESGEIF